MVDVLTPEQRHKCMSNIKSQDTEPELIVRRIVHGMGYRFRLHRKDLPGKPDIVLPRYRKAIFVHGCFWHMHKCKYGKVKPKTNSSFWADKRNSNVARDQKNRARLKKDGWDVLIIWECWTKDIKKLERKLTEFLKNEI